MRFYKYSTATLIALLFAASTYGQTTTAPTKRTVEIILDASGSMLQEKKGETKVTTARKMISAFIQGTELDGSLVGLRTFGAKTGKCEDIELKLGYYPKDNARIQQIIHGIKPRVSAKTPLAEALKAAHKSLKEQEGQKSIVVMTDGIETCKGDPCAVAKELRKDMDIKIYIVAYGLKNKKQFKELECLVDEPQDLMTPQSPSELSQSFAQIHKNIKKVKQTILIKSPDPEVWATAVRIDGKKDEFRFISTIGTELPPGTYKVTVEFPVPFVFEHVELKKGEIKVLSAGGEGNLKPRFAHPAYDLHITNADTGQKSTMRGDEAPRSLIAGRYTILALSASGLAYQWPTVVVTPGETHLLEPPPWGVLMYRSDKKNPYRVYKQQQSSAEIPSDKKAPKVKKLVKEMEQVTVALTNTEILLEEGVYQLVFSNGFKVPGVKIRRGKVSELPEVQ